MQLNDTPHHTSRLVVLFSFFFPFCFLLLQGAVVGRHIHDARFPHSLFCPAPSILSFSTHSCSWSFPITFNASIFQALFQGICFVGSFQVLCFLDAGHCPLPTTLFLQTRSHLSDSAFRFSDSVVFSVSFQPAFPRFSFGLSSSFQQTWTPLHWRFNGLFSAFFFRRIAFPWCCISSLPSPDLCLPSNSCNF